MVRLAGIQGAKRTATLIPLCHPLPLDRVGVEARPEPGGVRIFAEARTRAATGVEMEALTAAAVASLALIDMVKGVERGATVTRCGWSSRRGERAASGAGRGSRRSPGPRTAADDERYPSRGPSGPRSSWSATGFPREARDGSGKEAGGSCNPGARTWSSARRSPTKRPGGRGPPPARRPGPGGAGGDQRRDRIGPPGRDPGGHPSVIERDAPGLAELLRRETAPSPPSPP